MNIAQTWSKAISVMFLPKKEWKVIEASGKASSAFVYLLLFAILVGFAACIRPIFHGNFSAGFALGVKTFIVLMAITLLSAFLTYIYSSNFESKTTFSKALQLVVFSLTPVFFGLAIVSLIGSNLLFTLVFAIFSVILIYIGLPIMFQTPSKQRLPFTGLIAITLAALIILAWFLLRYI